MPGPLDGIRIIDLTSNVSGPLATMMLGDQGADVIKVEHPGTGGDYARQATNRQGGFPAVFLNNNRSKRSITLDLKTAGGIEAVKRLAEGADAIVQNFRPGVIERMGLGEDDIRAVAPHILYVSISGFGHEGPYAHKPVYDPLIQALSGLASIQGGSDGARPRLVRTIVPDKLTAVTAAQAISAGLIAKLRTGEGQHIRLSMLDSVVAFLWSSDMGGQTFIGGELPQQKAASFIDLIYETRDGYITVAVQTDRQWAGLCEALEKPEWLEDPRFVTAALRQDNIDERLAMTQEVLASGTSAHWLARLEAADVPCVPVLTRSEMIDHPQIAAMGTVREYDHPAAGRLRQARPAAVFSRTPADVTRPGPALGEHTGEVLREAGYSDADIEELRASGALGSVHQEAAE